MRIKPRKPSAYIRAVAMRMRTELPWVGPYQPMPIEPILFNPDTDTEDPDFRWYDCPNYDKCLDVAAYGNWISFTCAGCKVRNLQPKEERDRPDSNRG